jgi:carboxymethylenebutenolidase
MPTQQWLTVPTASTPMRLFTARPDGEGPFPAVVVIQEVLGVNDNIQSIATRLAGEGFFAAAPELYHREPKTTFTFAELQDAIAAAMRLTDEGLVADLNDACAALKARPEVKPGPLGIVGFCLGGRVALIAAAHTPHFGAVASFYGSRIAGTPLVDEVARLQIPICIFYGGNDPWIPVEQPRAIAARLAERGSSAELVVYEQAGHGFVNRPEESPANADAAAASWSRTLRLFKSSL